MQPSTTILALLVTLCVATASSTSIGDRLYRDYTQYIPIPTTAGAARSQGWTIDTQCDPNRGYRATYDGPKPTQSTPVSVFFTEAGQVAGVGVNIYGDVKDQLVAKGFFETVSNGEYSITVSFRNASMMCSGSQSEDALGDSLIINAGNLGYKLPIFEKDAIASKWTKGSCFYGMGHHYFYDLVEAPSMSWEAANLLPIVPMYYNGTINAFFFASSVVQQGIFSPHWWERIPLIDALMCKNWCDSSCTFHDTIAWSTLHIYLKDYTQVHCADDCTIGCCP